MLFRKKIERYCTYCTFSGKIDDNQVICEKCGIVPSNHHCRRFRYDPLKRVPAASPKDPFSKHKDKDFSL